MGLNECARLRMKRSDVMQCSLFKCLVIPNNGLGRNGYRSLTTADIFANHRVPNQGTSRSRTRMSANAKLACDTPANVWSEKRVVILLPSSRPTSS